MLRYLHPALQHMDKGERYDGVGAPLRRFAYAIIEEYYMSYYAKDPEVKARHVLAMAGKFGAFQAAFEVSCQMGVMKDEFKLPISERMERIEEGVRKWNNSKQSAQRQVSSNAPRDAGGADGQGQWVKGGGVSFTPTSDSP